MTSKIMHYNMATQRALVFMSPSNSVFAVFYPVRQDQSYEWIAGFFMHDLLCVIAVTDIFFFVCVCVYFQSLAPFVLQEIKGREMNEM